eukprot:12068453-Alexandrium_andersonii.AAC.1
MVAMYREVPGLVEVPSLAHPSFQRALAGRLFQHSGLVAPAALIRARLAYWVGADVTEGASDSG